MNHKKQYDLLISKARSEKRVKHDGVYYESHHILPLCMGGDGKESEWDCNANIILLTAKEHFVAHKLLLEMYPESKELQNALWMMMTCSNNKNMKERNYIVTSKEYERLKINFALSLSHECYLYSLFNDEVLTFVSHTERSSWGKKNLNLKIDGRYNFGICNGEWMICNEKITQDEKNEKLLNMKGFSQMKIYELDINSLEIIKEWPSIRSIIRSKNINPFACLSGTSQHAGGSRWVYKHIYHILGKEKTLSQFKPIRVMTKEFINDCISLPYTVVRNKYRNLWGKSTISNVKQNPKKYLNRLIN